MKYLCGKCIHFDVCYVPRTRGCVEICGHFKEEPKEPLTEQEYLQTCNTEQLAEWLFRFRHNYRHTLSDADKMEIEDISWWLKQPHTTGGTK